MLQFTLFISSSKSYQNITTKLSSFLWITWRQFQITATRTRYLCLLLWIAYENGRHFASLVSLRNEVWGPSAEVPCWRRVGSVSNWLKICFSVCSGSKGGAVVRALASHQCGPGSYPGVDAICGLSLLLVLSLAPRGFSPGTLVFPSP